MSESDEGEFVRSETWDYPVGELVGGANTYEELKSCFLNPRDFPGRFPVSKCILLYGVPGMV